MSAEEETANWGGGRYNVLLLRTSKWQIQWLPACMNPTSDGRGTPRCTNVHIEAYKRGTQQDKRTHIEAQNEAHSKEKNVCTNQCTRYTNSYCWRKITIWYISFFKTIRMVVVKTMGFKLILNWSSRQLMGTRIEISLVTEHRYFDKWMQEW